MVLGRCIYGCTNQSDREFTSGCHIISAAADLELSMGTTVHLTDMKMGIGYGITGQNLSDNNLADILSHFIHLFHLKTAGKQFVLKLLWCNIYIYIFF